MDYGYGVCPKCGLIRRLTKHHIFPKRFFGCKGPIKYICRECHDALEKLIPFYVVLRKKRYWEIYNDFLKGG